MMILQKLLTRMDASLLDCRFSARAAPSRGPFFIPVSAQTNRQWLRLWGCPVDINDGLRNKLGHLVATASQAHNQAHNSARR